MNHPLVYLLTRTFWNGALFRLRRLRQPKYLLGAVVGVLYMFLLFGRFYFLPSGPNSHLGRSDPFSRMSFAPQSAALLLFVFVLLFAWIFPGSRAALFFKEAEIAWLFPAPFKRSTLIHFKLIESQLGLITASLVFTFVRGRAFQSGAIPMILGWWIILFTFRLHRLAASFALQRLREHGLADTKRRIIFAVGVCALVAAVYFMSRHAFSSRSLRDQIAELPRLLESPAAHWLLLPFRLVVAPCFAGTTLGFFTALGPAAAITILQYLWVVRADVSFEEAAIARAQWYADFLARRQRGELSFRKPPKDGRAALFELRPKGPIFVAFFWKALLQFGGRQHLRNTFAIIVGVFIVARFTATAFPMAFAATFALCFGAMAFMVFLIPNQAAMQFRRSIQMMDLLKSYPVRGWQLATGELVASLSYGLILQWSLAVFVAVHLHSYLQVLRLSVSPSALIPCIAAVAAVFPGLNLVAAFLPCASILLFPAWFKGGKQEIEAAGMRLLLGFGQLIALSIALVPAAGLAFLTWWLLASTRDPFHLFIAAALVAAAVLLVEGLLGLFVLGRLFDEFDATEEKA